MKRLAVRLLIFLLLSFGVGVLTSGGKFVDWELAGGLFAVAVVGEGAVFLLQRKRSRTRVPQDDAVDVRRESSGI